ncbi:MAG TPA: ATP synthase F0 subunit B [Polyangiaceae bacterium]|nr:ATP synthase F0 subunit B [Polyangiaceae bacterium]
MRRLVTALCVAFGLLLAPLAFAQEAHRSAPAAASAPKTHAAHGAAHAEHHAPTFDDINWFYGWFGERDGVEPSILFRPKGMPAPFGIWILDAALLYGFLIRIAKKPLSEALKTRKANILRGMDEAARMKREAEKRLAEYEEKLARIEDEVERVRREMRASAEAERVRILADARARRERMEKDAELLVAQELAGARDELKRELITAAFTSAASSVKERLKSEDQQRLADEYLAGLAKAGGALRGRA